MSVRDLIPWGRNSTSSPTTLRDTGQLPFLSFHREVNRLFDDMWRGLDLPSDIGRFGSLTTSWPHVEISETAKDIRVVAEVPGLDEKDVEVVLDDGVLTIRGEKKAETESNERHFTERYYGRFERRIALGIDVDRDNVSASFKNGVLSVVLPKSEKTTAQSKRIPITAR